MALTIRDVMADLETKIEALTPVTDATETFIVETGFVSSGDESEIPESISHRRILLSRLGSEPVQDIGGTTIAWDDEFQIGLLHVWKRRKAFEAEIIHAEDVHMLTEMARNQRPGASAGARLWTPRGEERLQSGDRWRTNLVFAVESRLTEVVSP